MSSLAVVVVGASGRMGTFACDLLAASTDFTVAARVERGDDLSVILRETHAPLGLDLTRAGLGEEHARTLLEHGVRPVVGTSGVDREATARLDALARERALGGIVVPNLSLGMCLLQEAAASAAAWFPDAEIVEKHRAGKVDSPSSTARMTAERIAEARGDHNGAEAGPAREFSVAGVPIHAVRLPGLEAHQEILLGSTGELLTFRHDVTSREAYGPGLLLALGHAASCDGVAYGLGAALR